MTGGRQSRFGQWAGVSVSQGKRDGIGIRLPSADKSGDSASDAKKDVVQVKRPQPRTRPQKQETSRVAASLPFSLQRSAGRRRRRIDEPQMAAH